MSSLEILTQFVTVFLGAFLAFWLENVRERRQLQRQLGAYVRQFARSFEEDRSSREAATSASREVLDLYTKLIETDHAPSDRDWRVLSVSVTVSVPDWSFLYSGSALNVLPPDVVSAFKRIDEQLKESRSHLEDYRVLYIDYVVPIVIRTPEMLEETDKRALDLAKGQLEDLFSVLFTALEGIPELLELLERHGYYVSEPGHE